MKLTTIVLGIFAAIAAASPVDISSRRSGLVDDYPYKNQCNIVDKWGCLSCQCTSFVAWRLQERLGVKFDPSYGNVIWGNAGTWDEAARSAGLRVNSKPSVGAIAQSENSATGHVAWVAAVHGDTVTIEEYNFGGQTTYHTRNVPASNYNYIYFD